MARRVFVALVAVFGAGLAVMTCIPVDHYPPPPRFDGGNDGGDVTLPDASTEMCVNCLAAQCEPEWGPCNGDPDCMTCLTDPLGEACTQSVNRHALRNCACVRPTCLDACQTLCFKIPPVVAPGARIPPECIVCTTSQCADTVGACIADSVCFGCVTDSQNPVCTENQAWNATTRCLCSTPRHCFEECCNPATPPP